jgi:hypothetical protein
MNATPITNYIGFGLTLRYLIDTQAGWHIQGEGHVVENAERVMRHLQDLKLLVTYRASGQLKKMIDELKVLTPESRLTAEQASRLRAIMNDLRTVLAAEARGLFTYTVAEKRLDVQKLLEDIGALFGTDVFFSLPDIARYDFGEAGLCVAFSRPTAAAFHLLRGTESMLRQFYCARVKRNRVTPLLWGPMVGHLRKRRNRPPEILLNNLDNIRVSYRNPTQHPELRYDMDEAQDLFGLCIEVVNRMSRLI